MSDEQHGMSGDQIERVFGTLARIEQKIDGHTKWTTEWTQKHEVSDAQMAGDIKKLEMSSARQRGFMTALAAVGSVIGAGIGYLAEYLHR